VIDTRNPACDELFDAVSQSLFAIGLQIEHCIESTENESVVGRLDASVQGLHDIIAMIRARGELHCGPVCT
jgi:signal transduction histidine kinase